MKMKEGMTVCNNSKFHQDRGFILRVLTDPEFRDLLICNPCMALGINEITPLIVEEINKVLLIVDEIENQIYNLADELLCANGGPCGIS